MSAVLRNFKLKGYAMLSAKMEPNAWAKVMARFEAATDDEEIFDLREIAMVIPAPDLAALHWKLRYVFEPVDFYVEEADFTPSWSRKYLAQTLADIDRLLAVPVGKGAA